MFTGLPEGRYALSLKHPPHTKEGIKLFFLHIKLKKYVFKC